MVRQFHVYFVNLDPAVGFEIKKSRPCVVLSPNDMNAALGTVLAAPMTTTLRGYPSRSELTFNGKHCEICVDQMRALDTSRFDRKSIGKLTGAQVESVKDVLAEVFEL